MRSDGHEEFDSLWQQGEMRRWPRDEFAIGVNVVRWARRQLQFRRAKGAKNMLPVPVSAGAAVHQDQGAWPWRYRLFAAYSCRPGVCGGALLMQNWGSVSSKIGRESSKDRDGKDG